MAWEGPVDLVAAPGVGWHCEIRADAKGVVLGGGDAAMERWRDDCATEAKRRSITSVLHFREIN